MSYTEFSQKPVSEKFTLAWVEPAQRLLLWENSSGSVYKRDVNYWVIDATVSGTSLTEGSSTSLNAGEWYFDSTNLKLYVRLSDDSNPNSASVIGYYRLFFGTTGANLPYDLATGSVVHYEGYLSSVSNFPQSLDNTDQIGVALETNGNLSFDNNDGFFDSIYDTLIWENKTVKVYSWSPELNATDARLIFDGEITDKSFSTNVIRFKVKDFVHKLRQEVALNRYLESDGDLPGDILGIPKRRLYGRHQYLRVQSLDQVLGGYTLTGTVTGVQDASTITGTGTSFLDELSPDDEIAFTVGDLDYSVRVATVDSDTQLTLSEGLDVGFTDINVTVTPSIPYRKKNRSYFVADHKLSESQTTITAVLDLARINVSDGTQFLEGDNITVNSEDAKIRRISGNTLVLQQTLNNTPTIGDTVKRIPVSNAYFNKKKLVLNRDYTVSNTASSCKITLDNKAEFNVTTPKKLTGTLSVTGGSRTVTGSGTLFKEEVRPRDWIRVTTTGRDYQEVLQVIDDTTLELRVGYTNSTQSGITGLVKPVEYISDDSIVTVDCVGKEDSDGNFIRYAAEVVKDLVVNDAGITNINTTLFDEAINDSRHMMSLAVPLEFADDEAPTIREIIDVVNRSVIGSVYTKDFQVSYKILDSERDIVTSLKDDDILSWSIDSKTEIVKKVVGKYRHFDADRFSLEEGSNVVSYENPFVTKFYTEDKELEIDLYLYDQSSAETIIQRYALIRSLTSSVIKIRSKLNLTTLELNDPIRLDFDRLYTRFGSSDRIKVGLISSISRGERDTTVEVNDLGNLYNRTGQIAPNTANDFSSSTREERSIYAYIVDNTLEVPDTDSETNWGQNLIG